MISRHDPWISRPRPRESARLRLFCFPYAGAGSVIYRDWPAGLPDWIDVCAIEVPGRLVRRSEPPIRDITALTRELSRVLVPWLDRPFAFFGYSLGALTAFEVARELRRTEQREPEHLMVAASRAPQLTRRLPPISGLPRDEFVRALEQRYEPFEPLLRADPEMFAIILQIMRVDLAMFEGYQYRDDEPLGCPILALGGSEDASVQPAELEGWRAHTRHAFRAELVPGAHFFLRKNAPRLHALVAAQLTSSQLALAAPG